MEVWNGMFPEFITLYRKKTLDEIYLKSAIIGLENL